MMHPISPWIINDGIKMENTQPRTPPNPVPPPPPAKTVPSMVTPDQQSFIHRPSFGAFSLGLIYFLASGLMKEALLMLVPFFNIYLWFKGIFRGRRMSWQKGEWRDFDTFKKRQKTLDYIGIVFFVIWLALISFAIVTTFAVTRAPIKGATQFMDNIGTGKIEQAYNNAAPEFRSQGTLDEFKSYLSESTHVSAYAKVKFTSADVTSDATGTNAVVIGEYTTTSGEKYPVEVDLTKDGNSWKVYGVAFNK